MKSNNNLAIRIIPCLDVKDGRVVKGVNFLNLQDAGSVKENAIFYDKELADELVFLDITASSEKRDIVLNIVKKVAESIFIPFTVGGGVKELEDVELILREGADKVSINTACVYNPSLIEESAKRFGSQCIVVAVDAKKNGNLWQVYTHGGRTPTKIDAIWWIKKAEELGAGEILLTSMDRDGTKMGYDIELLKKATETVSIPIIASGGAGKLEHFHEAILQGKASALLAASLFHYRKLSIKQVKEYLKRKNINVRL